MADETVASETAASETVAEHNVAHDNTGAATAAPNGSGSKTDAQTIDQVRELLFGTEQRSLEQQIVALREEMAQDRDRFQQELAAVQTAAEQAAEKDRNRTDDHIRKIGEALHTLGDAIVKLPR